MILVRLMLIATVFVTTWSLVFLTAMMPWAWLILPIVLGCKFARRRYQLSAFGTARFAEASDLRRAGMLDSNTGLIIGRADSAVSLFSRVKALFNPLLSSESACQQFFRKRTGLVRLSRGVHAAIFAPVGVGKTTGIAIPHLLTCQESCVVVDFKGELARITAKARRAMGHRVVLLDPYRQVTQTPDTFNPLDFIDPRSPLAIDECRDLAEALVVRTGQERERHWDDGAEMRIGGITAAVVHYGQGRDKSLQSVRSVLTNEQEAEALIKSMKGSDAWDGMLSRVGHQLGQFRDKELASVVTTTNRHMRFLDTPAIVASTTASTFDPAEMLRGKTTVYLILPPDHARAASPLLRLWIGSLLRAVVRGGLQEKNKVHFVLDEAASLGHMEALDDAVDKYRGYGVRLQLYYQSLGQLKRCWPDGQDQTLLSNTSQVFFGVNENQTADYVSVRLGDETIVTTSGGTSTGSSHQHGDQAQRSTSYSTNESNNWSQQGRRLLKPEEVMALHERIAITFTPGVPPICTRLTRYYEEAFRENWLRRLFSRARMLVLSVVLLLFALMMAALVASPLFYRNPHPNPHSVFDDPLEGMDSRSFESR
jgi:type IV secretion system protein VirD4